jgi:hypothetical protein
MFIPYQDNIPYIIEVRKTINSNAGKTNLELQGSDEKVLDNYIDEELGENI